MFPNLIKEEFKKMDQNGDGFISRQELKEIMEKQSKIENLNEEDIDGALEEADENQDGQICFQEFVEYIIKYWK